MSTLLLISLVDAITVTINNDMATEIRLTLECTLESTVDIHILLIELLFSRKKSVGRSKFQVNRWNLIIMNIDQVLYYMFLLTLTVHKEYNRCFILPEELAKA